MGDILIKGMEMPKEGNWRSIRIYPDGTIGRPIGFGDYALVEGAKAVPVPPHGDLIDRDAVSLEGGPYEYDEWCKWALEQYQDAPTIIPAEEAKDD